MSYLPKSADPSMAAPFARNAGLDREALPAPDDPIAAWLALMDVVEALCPEWPKRELSPGADYRM